MNNDTDSRKLIIQQTIRDSLDNNNYKTLGKHSNCSKCGIALTRDNYRKSRTISETCFSDNAMCYTKRRYDNQTRDKPNSIEKKF